jgi:amidohydrolase
VSRSWKHDAVTQIDAAEAELTDLSCKIQAHPELAYEEFSASTWLSDFLEARGFEVVRGAGGLPTAFVATRFGNGEGPNLAFLAEYDALPGIGHGCGHNLIGVGAVGAALGVSAVLSHLSGSIQVIGTPAEEYTDGKAGKIKLLEAGVFADVDACLMFHPWTETALALADLGFGIFDATFRGQTAHAAGDPWNGLNAQDAAVLTYSAVSVLRQQLRPDARVHCLITHAGDAVNIIPMRSSIRVMFRAPEPGYLQELSVKVGHCAEGAALATGTRLELEEITRVQPSRLNPTMCRLVEENMTEVGQPPHRMELWPVSSDFGNVSQALPSLSLLIRTHEPGTIWHSRAVAETATSDQAHAGMLLAAKVLAMSAIDLFAEPGLLKSARLDHTAGEANDVNA